MVGTSKILTVSYGTFSCTLEGFDDSFSTMKAIAEYFRGLAADDRYFGAEPPTPDAEMLASIAEREISRRVDAHQDESGIVLRAAALEAPSEASDEKIHDEASRAKVEAERKAAKAARKAEKAREKAARKAAKEAQKAEAKAAKEAVEAEAAEKAAADAKADADAKAAEDARDKDADASEHSILESVSSATAEPAEGTTESEIEETRDVAPSSVLAVEDSAPENSAEEDAAEADVPAHPDADSVAAKLQRIRAVVGKSGNADPAPSDDLTEQFLPQSDAPDVADPDVGESETDVDAAVGGSHDASEDATDEAEDTQGGDDMISRVMARHSDDAAEAEAEEATISEDAVEVEAAQPVARVVRMKRADFEKAAADADSETVAAPNGPDFGLLDGADELDDYLEDSDFTDGDMSGADDADLAEDLKAIQEDATDDMEADALEADAAEPDSTVDAISAALAAQGDAAQDDAADAAEANVAEDTSDDLNDDSDEPHVDEAALDRLMDETDAQMQEPEGSRRRDAIAQLKAAVAAKEAARQVGEPEDDGQDVENAFRNDLSEAVSPEGTAAPRRPVVRTTNRTERPRPAPLKLVAAQRVDLEEAAAQRDGPVVPRRVAARKEEATDQRASGSFAEFADNMGATELPDLLEAAAAYTSFVEGADEFSRPQILRRVRAVASDDFKREDELRSFAELISAGRFTKVRNGRFQVADDSRFNPERRAS